MSALRNGPIQRRAQTAGSSALGVAMDTLNVYRRNDGGYLLAPDCMQASIHEQRIYGPLILLGVMEVSDLGALGAIVALQLEDSFFALVDQHAFEAWRTPTPPAQG